MFAQTEKDDAISLIPPIDMTLEKAIEYIGDDEYIEVTPLNIRLSQKYRNENDRKRMQKARDNHFQG